ncbi:AAA family ATPase [Campylobacter lari]|uniref:AAA family ATPase n=1 Tax=Campylobacter lari TaxID=201 RepID=UPI000B3FD913|nr:AAA family ATPase [Campylobacter lari]MCR6776434.1 AAA family ATPase [Campylobacter lari]
MIKDIKIRNYKIIKELDLDDFKNINIFTGKNNCGKSTILEAVYLTLAQDNIKNLIYSFDIFRYFSLDEKSIKFLFYNFDMEKTISLYSNIQDTYISLNISLEQLDEIYMPNILKNGNEDSIKLQFEHGYGKKSQINTLTIQNKDTSYSRNTERKYNKVSSLHKNNTIFFPVNIFSFEALFFLRKIRSDNQEGKLINFLKFFDESILDVEEINQEIFIKSSKFKIKAPIKIFGYGFIKFFNYICVLVANDAKYILIDEIENGLHYENIKKLIVSLVKLSSENNIQIFISTHSLEFLQILEKSIDEANFMDVNIYNIYNIEDNIYSKQYFANQLNELLDNNIELRR